jgi:hypothetical protein
MLLATAALALIAAVNGQTIESKDGGIVVNVVGDGKLSVVKHADDGSVLESDEAASASNLESIEGTLFGRVSRDTHLKDGEEIGDNLVTVTAETNTKIVALTEATAAAGVASAGATRFAGVPFALGMANADSAESFPTGEELTFKVFGRNFIPDASAMGCQMTVGAATFHQASVSDISGESYMCSVAGLAPEVVTDAKLFGIFEPTMFGTKLDYYATAADLNVSYHVTGPGVNVASVEASPDDGYEMEVDSAHTVQAADFKDGKYTIPLSFIRTASKLDEVTIKVEKVDPSEERTDLDTLVTDMKFQLGDDAVEDGTADSLVITFGDDVSDDQFYFKVTATDDNYKGAPASEAIIVVTVESPEFILAGRANRGWGWGCYMGDRGQGTFHDATNKNQNRELPKLINKKHDKSNSDRNSDNLFYVAFDDDAEREGAIRLYTWDGHNGDKILFTISSDGKNWRRVNRCNGGGRMSKSPFLQGGKGKITNQDGNEINGINFRGGKGTTYLQVTKAWGKWKYFGWGNPGWGHRYDEATWCSGIKDCPFDF